MGAVAAPQRLVGAGAEGAIDQSRRDPSLDIQHVEPNRCRATHDEFDRDRAGGGTR